MRCSFLARLDIAAEAPEKIERQGSIVLCQSLYLFAELRDRGFIVELETRHRVRQSDRQVVLSLAQRVEHRTSHPKTKALRVDNGAQY